MCCDLASTLSAMLLDWNYVSSKSGFPLGGWMVFQSVDFFLQKEVSAGTVLLGLKGIYWKKAIGRHGVVHFIWIIDHGIVWLPLFCWIFLGDLDLPSQPTSKDSLWIHDINLFQTTTGLTSKPWVNTNQMLGVVRSIGKDAHFLKPKYCEWKFLEAYQTYHFDKYFFHTLQPWGFVWLDQCRINRSFGEL